MSEQIKNRVKLPYNFQARDYQIPFLKEVELAMTGKSEKRFFYQVWHRRSGKDKCNIADVVPRRLVMSPCQVKYVYPTSIMGRSNLWESLDKDGFRLINHIPESIRADENATRTQSSNESRMILKVRNDSSDTPSLFQVIGANHPDSLRGGNPKLWIFSEWADHDPYAWDVVEPIVRENDGIVIFNTTPKGDNHARALLEFARNHPKWFVQTLTVEDTGIFTKQQMIEITNDVIQRFEANGRSRDEAEAYIQQEYYCSFDSPVLGSYYGAGINKAEQEGRVSGVPYEMSLPVHTAWDLGIDDSMTIWMFQIAGNEIHFIDYIEGTGEGLPYYASELQQRGYVFGQHYAPHDIEVRELGTGKSRKEVARALGINFTTAPKMDLMEGINAVRMILNKCWFDKTKCYRGVQALKNYKKDWDDKNMVFRKNPLHNWASHGCDALRTFAMTYRKTQGPITNNFGGVKPMIPGMLV